MPNVVNLVQKKDGAPEGCDPLKAPLTENLTQEGDGLPKSSKSPAFQFYPSDFIGSSKVQRMPLAERGAYITLLAFAWLDHGLPTDMGELGRMVGLTKAAFTKMWDSQLYKCFVERSGKFVNLRQEDIRKAQADYRKRQRDNAAKGWQSRGNAVASERHMPEGMPKACSPTPTPTPSPTPVKTIKKKIAPPSATAEPPADAVLTFPTIGPVKTWHLTREQVESWSEAYPGMDVLAEARRALVWVQANQRKTAGGMRAFLVRWLNTSANKRGGTGAGTPDAWDAKFAGLREGKP